jgi:hypothetical protein
MTPKRKPTVLVVYDTATNRYKRFEGKVRTNHVQAEYPMTPSMLEQFRSDPDSLLGPSEDDGGGDEVA